MKRRDFLLSGAMAIAAASIGLPAFASTPTKLHGAGDFALMDAMFGNVPDKQVGSISLSAGSYHNIYPDHPVQIGGRGYAAKVFAYQAVDLYLTTIKAPDLSYAEKVPLVADFAARFAALEASGRIARLPDDFRPEGIPYLWKRGATLAEGTAVPEFYGYGRLPDFPRPSIALPKATRQPGEVKWVVG